MASPELPRFDFSDYPNVKSRPKSSLHLDRKQPRLIPSQRSEQNSGIDHANPTTNASTNKRPVLSLSAHLDQPEKHDGNYVMSPAGNSSHGGSSTGTPSQLTTSQDWKWGIAAKEPMTNTGEQLKEETRFDQTQSSLIRPPASTSRNLQQDHGESHKSGEPNRRDGLHEAPASQKIFSQLDVIRQLQLSIASEHSKLEGIRRESRSHVDEEVSKKVPDSSRREKQGFKETEKGAGAGGSNNNGTGPGGIEESPAEKANTAKAYQAMAKDFMDRQQGMQNIMSKLSDLSAALKTFHTLPSPVLFPPAPPNSTPSPVNFSSSRNRPRASSTSQFQSNSRSASHSNSPVISTDYSLDVDTSTNSITSNETQGIVQGPP